MRPRVEVKYTAPPTLAAFLDSNAFVRCVMGPVGSGKSSSCVLEILRRAKEQRKSPDGIRRTRFAVIRNTYGQLRDTTRKTFEEWIPADLGKWNEQQFSFRMRFSDVDCEILFRALDRPEDVKKLLSLDLTGAYVNEAREISQYVFEVLQTRVGRFPSKVQGGASWFGIWMDSNPWHTGHWCHKLFSSSDLDVRRQFRLYRQPGGRSASAENFSNLPTDYYQRLCIGKDSDWIRVYVDGEEASSDIGSIFGDAMEEVALRGGVGEFEHAQDGIFTSWDLGKTDSTAIWFWRPNVNGVDLIDHYENHGKGLEHFFGVVDAKPYQYVKHWLPHDANQHTLATQLSVLDQCRNHWGMGKVAIGPSMGIIDGIQAGRWLLEQPGTRIHTRCSAVAEPGDADGIEALREYRYEWDEIERVFSRRPLHNWASHTGDAFRYCAVVTKVSELITRKPKPATPKPVAVPVDRAYNLEQLFVDNESRRRTGRI